MTRPARSFERDSQQRSSSGAGSDRRGSERRGSERRSGGGRRSGAPTGQSGQAAQTAQTARQVSSAKSDFALPVSTTPALPPVGAFSELDMPRALLDALSGQGVVTPFPIQASTLPNALAGRDVLARGRTGSGKTIAFGLALLARTAGRRAEPRRPLALVLVPTRELAQQVSEALTPFAHAVRLRTAVVVGGMSITRQAQALRSGAEIVVATPGRLKDLIERGDCHLDQVAITVLDEADQMADMGFLPQVTELLEQVAPGGQTMLFSATLDRNIDRLVRRFLTDPVTHSVDPAAATVSTMEHHLLHVQAEDKNAAVTRIAARDGGVIMFMDTRHGADRLVRTLLADGVRAAALHGGKSQPQRTRTLQQFRDGQVTALIATNVAARGIHVEGLDLVVNIDPPADHKDYLHRGGRTARAGESGTVVTLVLPTQRRDMTRMMAAAGITPHTAHVHSADDELARITGARVPTGIPVTIPDPVVERPRHSDSGGSGRSRRARGGNPARGGQGGGASRTGQGGGVSRAGQGSGASRTSQGSAASRTRQPRRPQKGA